MSHARIATKNDCAGEDHQQFTRPDKQTYKLTHRQQGGLKSLLSFFFSKEAKLDKHSGLFANTQLLEIPTCGSNVQ
jgi:hypothetical protein